MKESYLKVVLPMLIVVIAVQAYFLYDMNRSAKKVSLHPWHEASLAFEDMEGASGFFDEKRNPFIEMERLRHEMESNFRDVESYFHAIPSLNTFFLKSYRLAPFDIKEQNGKYVVTMEIPGSLSDAISVKTENGMLSVSAKVVEKQDDDAANYFHRERYVLNYRREVSLPSDADVDTLKREYKDGLLIITMDKTSPVESQK